MRGTWVNTATVAVGGGLGTVLHNNISPAWQTAAMNGIGLFTLVLGIKMAMASNKVLELVAAISIGGVLGTILQISGGMHGFGEWAQATVGAQGRFSEAIVTCTLLFCVGPMTLLGCLQDSLENKPDLLYVKSAMDGIGAIFFGAAMGIGVVATAALVLIIQGGLSLLAKPLSGLARRTDLLDEASAVGGLMIVSIGFGLLEIRNFPTADYLPAVVLAPLCCLLSEKFGKVKHAS